MTRIIFVIGLAFGLLSFAATAIGDHVIWDESINGDLSNFVKDPTDLVFPAGDSLVIASVGGNSNPNIGDGYDVFGAFQAIGARWLFIGLESYETVANNADSQLDVYDYQFGGGVGDLLYSTMISEADVGVNLVDQIFDQLQPDFPIVLAVSEFDVKGQGYSIRIGATPEPSTSIVIAITILGLIGLRKR